MITRSYLGFWFCLVIGTVYEAAHMKVSAVIWIIIAFLYLCADNIKDEDEEE